MITIHLQSTCISMHDDRPLNSDLAYYSRKSLSLYPPHIIPKQRPFSELRQLPLQNILQVTWHNGMKIEYINPTFVNLIYDPLSRVIQ